MTNIELKTLMTNLREFIRYKEDSLSYTDKLSDSIKREYLKHNIDIRTYEQFINTLTCLRLMLEEMNNLSISSLTKGVYIDEKA